MSQKEYTAEEVKQHVTKDDLFIVVHSKVYDCTKFLDEHPGGEEVMIDVAGMDASDAFEDVGHSDEAREQLEKLLVGTLKEDPNAPK
ncbi:cytochrome b5-like heme/steroid binding domain-containing protein, partial [Protomyces lactucae-debilis]